MARGFPYDRDDPKHAYLEPGLRFAYKCATKLVATARPTS